MPILNFQRRFIPRILDGSKVHTIRVIGKRKFKPEDTLFMQTGPRFHPERFAVHPCTRVREINLYADRITIWSEDGQGFVSPPPNRFAVCDGFANWAELQEFFKGQHDGLRRQLIQWSEAEWE